MKQGQDLYDVTTRVLIGLREVLHALSQILFWCMGDTTISMEAALVAFYQQIPVGACGN